MIGIPLAGAAEAVVAAQFILLLPLLLLQVARYMSNMRRNRLQKLQNRQDDEVVGIAGLYLAITLIVLFMAALANLPI